MAEPTLPPYLGRTLLEDESDAEEAHQRERVEGGSLDSNVEKGEARGERFLITTLGTWIWTSVPPRHSTTEVKTLLFHLGEL